MNRTLPSDISVLTPPGWKLAALLNTPRAVDPMLLQTSQGWSFELGVMIVLNIVWATQPWAQSRPRCRSMFWPFLHAWSQAWMPAWTAGRSAPTGPRASITSAAFEIPPRLFIPMYFVPPPPLVGAITDSE